MQWNYQKIEYFLKVAETLNFSKAAKELFISPQSLNKQIIQLEEEIGEPLFERTTRQVKLTSLGRRMQQAFLPVREEFCRAVENVEGYMQRQKKMVRIAFFQAISKKEVVTPVTNYLRACEKDLQVELMGGELGEVIEWLYQGKCDLVITNIQEFEEWKGAEVIPFLKTPAKIAVSLYHPWVAKERITMQDMEKMPVLLLECKTELEKNSFYRNLKAKERLYTSNFSSLLANLGMGDSYSVIPKLFESMDQVGLQYIDLPVECEFFFQMAAIYRKDSKRATLFENLKGLAEEGSICIT